MISEAIETCCRSIPSVLMTPNVIASVIGMDTAIRMAVRQLQKPIKATTTTSTSASIKLWLKSSMLSCTCRGWSEVRATVAREDLVSVQTPQAFVASTLRQAHAAGGDATDDAALVEALGTTVRVVMGDPRNLKLTTPLDLAYAEHVLGQ